MTCRDGIDGHVFGPRRRTSLAIEVGWNNINWGTYRYVCVYYVSYDRTCIKVCHTSVSRTQNVQKPFQLLGTNLNTCVTA